MLSSVASFFVLSLPVMSLYSESTNTHSKVHIRIVNILFLVGYPELQAELFLTLNVSLLIASFTIIT